MEQQDMLMTVAEVAELMRVDSTSVRRWIKGGALEAVALPHVGDRYVYRIKQPTVEKILNGALPALKPPTQRRTRHLVRG